MDVFLKSMISVHLLKTSTYICMHTYIYICVYVCTYLWLCWVFIVVRMLSLVVESGGYFLITVHGLLIMAASLVERRL